MPELRSDDDVNDPGSESALTLASGKEIDLIVKSIEAASKHCRGVLLVLLVSSLYILLSAYSGVMGQSVELPVLKVAVSSQEFLAVSPLLIVVLYLYLHICVDDLRQRLRIFDRLHLQVAYVPFSRMLLFPSLLTMGFASQNPSVQLPSIDAELSQPTLPKTYVSSIVRLIVWGFAPLVLFLLWVRFIGEQQVVSLIPCGAIIASLFGSSGGAARSRTAGILGAFLSLTLVTISIASVPKLRATLPLETIWQAAVAVGNWLHHSELAAAVGAIAAFAGNLILSRFAIYTYQKLKPYLSRRRPR